MSMRISPIALDEDAMKKLDGFRDTNYTGEACAGMVKVTMSFGMECVDVKIAPEALADAELLEELMLTAIKDAIANVKAAHMDIIREMANKDMRRDGHVSFADILHGTFPINADMVPTMSQDSPLNMTATMLPDISNSEKQFLSTLLKDLKESLGIENPDK